MGTIQMKPNYIVETLMHYRAKFIVVDNYDSINKVMHFQCCERGLIRLIELDENLNLKKTIGIWKINLKNK